MKFLKALPKQKLQKIVLVAIVTLTSVGVIGYFYVAKAVSDLSTERERITKLTAQLDQAQSAAKSEVQNTELRDRIKTFVEAQQQRMITGDPFSWIVREISLLAENHSIRVAALRPGLKAANTTKSKYDMFSTNLELEGSFDQVGQFVMELENNFPAGQIRSLEVTPGDTGRGQCRAVIELALLMHPDDPARAPAKPSEDKKKAI